MCDCILAQLFSCVTLMELQWSQWLYASREPGLPWVRMCSASYRGENSQIFFLLSRHPHLKETDTAESDGMKYGHIASPLLSNMLLTITEVKSELKG